MITVTEETQSAKLHHRPELAIRYRTRAESFERDAQGQERYYNRLAIFRLLVFVGGIALALFLGARSIVAGIGTGVLTFAVFFWMVRLHDKVQQRLKLFGSLQAVNEAELAALHYQYHTHDSGAAFEPADHPYADDLDLFGSNSFFQYSNRAGTYLGKTTYAQWLSAPATRSDLIGRQESIPELSADLEWRQHFQAEAALAPDAPHHLAVLQAWIERPTAVYPQALPRITRYLAPLWMALSIFLWIYVLPWQIAIFLLLPPILILRRYREPIRQTHEQTGKAVDILRHYARLIGQVEAASFDSAYWQHITAPIRGSSSASQTIRKLAYAISQLNVRYNAFAIILNLTGLWDLHWVYQLEKWKAHNGHLVPAWLESLARVEALQTLATLHDNHPDWCMPRLHDKAELHARDIGHPLLPETKRVGNDLSMPTDSHLKLITGSNMAGKSTFLRTLGINMVLAMAGGPVCGRSFVLPELQVYTSMRVRDDLSEGASAFKAELNRLQRIIRAVEGKEDHLPKPFVLLDEILKGTNSRDRHTGSRALIQQLLDEGAAGLIATHDLDLGDMEAQSGGKIENLRMEVDIEDGSLHFDYRLKKGITQSFNATLLMQQMGIRVAPRLPS